ncbi:unnamed protein product [Closterium sp. NIES-53]
MYAVSISDEGDCYWCFPPDPGIETAALGTGEAAALGACDAAALGASASASSGTGESALSGTASASASLTFTLDSGASRSFFRDRTTLTPLSRPVAVSLADPSGGPILSPFSTVLPCPAAPSGTLSGLYLPSFSTNLVSGADLQDGGVHQFTPTCQRMTHCTEASTGRHLATFTRQPGSSLHTVTTPSPPVAESGRVAASGQVFAAASRSGPESAPCSCHLLSHETLLWHHRLGHPSLLRLRGTASRFLVSGLPRSLPPLPQGPGPTCVPCVEGRQRAAPHSSQFHPTEAPLQTLHMDVWGPARGKCALGTDVLEDKQEEFECFAASEPHLVSMLLAPERDPDALDIPTPRSYAEAIEGPYSSQWQAAMDAEMASSKSTGTYVDEVPPPGANIVSGMWIFRGVDFFQTFSPTPKMTTLRVLLHVAAQRDYELQSLDFSTAFLQGSLHEEIWLRRPPGFTGSFPAGTQWSLRRSVYGLRQAPREWHDTLRTTLASLGFAPSTSDPSLFLRTDTTLPPFYVLMYVDDLVFATADTEALAHVKSELQKRHTCTDQGELTSYLGLRITRDRAQRTITLTQSHMVQQVLQHFGFTYSSPQSTPLPTGHSLSAPPSDESVEPSGPYPELVGCLMYLMTCTRPELAYPLSLLARYVAPGRHRKVHWDAAKRVLRYLCSTSGMGLVLRGRARSVLTGHADASWVDDLATQRSSQGYTFSLGSGSVSWRSTRSSSVLSSSCEAEIYAGAMAAQELRWLTYLLTDLGEAPRSPPVLYANTADVFTKALQPCDHQRLCTVLGLLALPSLTGLINLQPRVSMPETSPTLRWTGKVGDASAFRVWGSRAFVRDFSADKLSSRVVPCVFLGFPLDAPGWQFYHPTSRCVLSSQDVMFDESVPYYRLFPYRAAPLPPPAALPRARSSSSRPPPYAVEPVEVAVDYGDARGAEPESAELGGAGSGGVEPGGAGSGGAEPGGAGSGGAVPGFAESGGAEPEGAGPARVEAGGAGPGGPSGASSRRELLSPQDLRELFSRHWSRAAGAGGAAGTGGPAAAGAAGGSRATGPGGARTGGTGAAGPGGSTGAGAGGAAGVGAAGGTGAGAAASSGGPTGARASGGAGAGGVAAAEAPLGAGVGASGAAGDIPTPRSYAEAIEGPYSSQWQTAMDAEMASWKSTGVVPKYYSGTVIALPFSLQACSASGILWGGA